MADFNRQDKTFVEVVELTRATASDYFDSNGALAAGAPNEPRFTHDSVTKEPSGLLVGTNARMTAKVSEIAKIRVDLAYFLDSGGRYFVAGTFKQGAPMLYSGENAMVRAKKDGYSEALTGYVNSSFNPDVRLGRGATATLTYERGAALAQALNIFEHLDNALQEWPAYGV